nr:hypothetical protein [Tanacetum cinerariifolium]
MVKFLGAIPINFKGNTRESEDMTEKKIDWNKQPKKRDGVWHIRIEMIYPNGEKFDRVFQLISTTRKLSEKEKPRSCSDGVTKRSDDVTKRSDGVRILYRVDGDDLYDICDELWFIVINNSFWKIMPPRMRTRSVGRPAAESLGGGTGVRVGRGGRGRRPREEGVNGNVEGANRGAPDFSTIIAQQLQNLLSTMLAQVGNQGNVGNQNGCSYKEFLACNPKEYDGKGGVVVLTRWIEKIENVQDMKGCSIDQKVKYTMGSFVKDATAEEVCTAKKLSINRGQRHIYASQRRVSVIPGILKIQSEMEQQNPTFTKIPILDIGKFKQWKFRIQQYLQNEHYALWEVIEFGDSYVAPQEESNTCSASESSAKKMGRIVAVTNEDMQKRRNDVKARTNLLLALPDGHQLRFTKYKTAQDLLQAIVSHLEFMDVEIEQDDLNQKFLTSLAPEWLMYTIVWKNRAKNSSGKEEVNTASIPTASTHVSPASADVAAASISLDTVCAYIASQSNGSQIKYEDINQIDEDEIKDIDIKFWKKTGKKITIQGTDVAGFYKLKVECFNFHKMGHFARECRAPRSQDRGRRENFKQGAKIEEQAPKALISIDEDTVLFSPPAQVYSPLKKDMTWTGLPEFTDDTITDYSRPSPSIESNSSNLQNSDSSVSENGESSKSIMSKAMIKFVKAADSPTVIKTNKVETVRKPSVKYAEMYRNTTKSPKVRGKTWLKNDNTPKSMSPRNVFHKTDRTPIRTNRINMNVAQPKRTSFAKPAHSYVRRPFQRKSTVRTQFRVPRVSTVNTNFSTVDSKFPTCNSKFSSADLGNKGKVVKASACWIWRPKQNTTDKGLNSNSVSMIFKKHQYIDTQGRLNGCSSYMTGNISYLFDYEPYDGGYVSFGQGGGKITGKGIIKIGKLEFENVYFVKDLKYNLFSMSQICDNKNSVLFTDSKCIVLGRDFKLKDDTNVLLRTPRQHNMYSIDLNNIVPHKDLTCLVAKASADESLPSKCFEHDHTCVACLKGKQHKASCKTKLVNSVSKPLYTLHMDLFGPTSVSSLNHKWYCLVVTDDFSRCDNRGEFRNKEMNDFCSRKGIKREFRNARTPQQNRVAERRNMSLIEAARTMLADAKLLVTFWAEAVNTAYYVQNRVLVNKSQNKTPYELFNGKTPAIGFLKPFGCHVMILNTLDHLGKFDAKGDEGTKDAASQDVKKDVSSLRYIALPNWFHEAHLESSTSNAQDACNVNASESNENPNPTATSTNPPADQMEILTVESAVSTSPVPTACLDDSPEPSSTIRLISKRVISQDETPSLDNISTLSNRFEDILGVTTNTGDTNGVKADLGNMEYNISASPTPTFRIHKDHLKSQIIGHMDTLVQTRNKSKEMKEQSFIATIHQKTNPDLLQFWVRPIRTKWVLKNKKDERGIVIRNKARLVAQGHTHEEGIDYEEVFASVARIEAIRLFLASASFMGFTVYQDPEFPARVYKVEKAMGTIDQTLFIRRHIGDFILVQVYVDDIIFGSSNPHLCREFETPMHEKFQMSAMGELNFFLGLQGKDKPGKDVDLHLYRSMIGSLMYLTASRPDIMFDVCVCARHQVTHKECHLHAVKRIFRYLKGHPKLRLWYPKDSPFDLVAHSDSDYGGATQDRRSTTGGVSFWVED